jgi:hypothetical protein
MAVWKSPARAQQLAALNRCILEVNTTPGFHYHYHKNDGSYPVAVRVPEQLFRDLRR